MLCLLAALIWMLALPLCPVSRCIRRSPAISCTQVDAVDRIIDLADSRDDLIARTALLKSSFQRVLVLALLPHDLIHAAEVQQDLKARFRLLHPIGAHHSKVLQ